MSRHGKSRKQTPWDGVEEKTPTQEFLQMHYVARYEQRHPTIRETGEASLINSYVPSNAPIAGQRTSSARVSTLMGFSVINVSAAKHSGRQPELFSIPARFPSANGWNIVTTSFVMSV